MTPFLKRNLLISFSIILLAALLACLVYVVPFYGGNFQHLEIIILSVLLLIVLLVMMLWGTTGVIGGLFCFILSLIFLYKTLTTLNPYYYSVLLLSFSINGFVGYTIQKQIIKINQDYKVRIEKINEDTNLINNHLKNRGNEIEAMEIKIDSFMGLQNTANDLSLSMEKEEVVATIVKNVFDRFHGMARVMFFEVDEVSKGITLAKTVKPTDRKAAFLKKGSILERWVFKNMHSLIVKNIKKDYRFSVDSEIKSDDFSSAIVRPLVSEGNVIGLLRADSDKDGFFSQHDLRILDIIGEFATVALENARLYKKTEELALKDSLTGLYVHRYFMDRIEVEIKRAIMSGVSFALLMMDLDDFKKFNDRYGHISGDIILRNVSEILLKNASAGDIVCRYGGEEFAFIALNKTKEEAIAFAEVIRKEVESSKVIIRREHQSVTVSTGIAMFPDDAKLKDDIIDAADKRLYKSKDKGKNKVCAD